MKQFSHTCVAHVICDCGSHIDIRLQTKNSESGEESKPCWKCQKRVNLKLQGGMLIGLVSGQVVGKERDRVHPRLIINYHTWE